MSSIPWPTVQLGNILTERHEIPSPDAIFNGEIPIVSKISFNNGQIELRKDGNTKTNMILIRPGDLVVSGINAAKGAIAIYDNNNKKPITATIHYTAYIPDEKKVDIHYLWFFLRSRNFQEILSENVPGGIKTELKAKRFLPIPIPLPSLPDQRLIVASIESLSSKITESNLLHSKVGYDVERLFKASLDNIFAQFNMLVDMSEVMYDKPRNGWSANCDNAEQGTPVLTLKAITGYKYRRNEFKRTSLTTYPDAHYWLKPGDLLITRSNTPDFVGHAAIYDGTPKPCIYSDLIMKIPINKKATNTRFVWYWLQCTLVRDFIRSKAKGTSPTMKKISQTVVMGIPFPQNAPLPKQREIVTYLDDLQVKIDSLKKLQAETEKELDALLPSILDKAFKGEL